MGGIFEMNDLQKMRSREEGARRDFDTQLSPAERQRRTATQLLKRKVMAAYGGVKQKVIKAGNGSVISRGGAIVGHELEAAGGRRKVVQNVTLFQSLPGQKKVVQNVAQGDAALGKLVQNVAQTDVARRAENTGGINAVDSVNLSQPSQPNFQNTSSYKQAPIQMDPADADWQKYHTAWQNYYQQYYSEYYARAARRYIETEQMKLERAQGDDANLLGAMSEANLEGVDRGGAKETLRERIRKKATDQARRTRRRRKFMPVVAGVAVVAVVLFLQFNRLIFAPIAAYVSPGNLEGSEITALDPSFTRAVSAEPKLIIPKLNVEVPVHFGISNDNATVMAAMNDGVAQFAIRGADAMPGENGNLVITGHSAGDVYSNNQYKFIFSGLERLTEGDKIYVNYESKQYAYAVTRMKTIEPTDLAALRETTGRPQLILVTCTPLGTSTYRLLVYAEQVSPAYEEGSGSAGGSGNSGSSGDGAGSSSGGAGAGATEVLPANEPSFFEGIWNFLTNSG